MIKSMTGYGDADGELDGVIYLVEIKSVNNRYFKPRIKLPESTAFLEENIYEVLRKNLARGTVEYTLKLKRLSADMLYDINTGALKTYLSKISNTPMDPVSLDLTTASGYDTTRYILKLMGVTLHTDKQGNFRLQEVYTPGIFEFYHYYQMKYPVLGDLEKSLNKKLHIPDSPQTIVALGAAIAIGDELRRRQGE